ncbi:MAG: UDP-N-acetylmuramoyl-tripeptide--D-alanyl-D-alanine ligase [Betaproteobacteria bacterium]|nr:MAG: UDP-N-acetylmuramoyl-tripeptide--D-alanyl-D-alanine ligase [Betaproteobacteria bacterium]
MMDTATAAEAIAGTLHGRREWFRGVTTDSRAVAPGDLFVAIKGERFDGHDYVAQALERGAVAAIVASDRAATIPGTLLEVDDPLRALGALARFWRRSFAIPVAAIVGSNGKTTAKEMTAAILRAEFGDAQVLATPGNLNNAIGLPLTLLRLSTVHRVAAIEIGMNHPGETAELASIATPTIGLINNAQREHQEFMASVADVAAEHAALLNALPERGVAVINADDDYASFWREVIARRNGEGAALTVRDFGLRANAALTARYQAESWGARIDVSTPEGNVSIDLKAAGRHNVANALGAIAAATAAGAKLPAAAAGLASFRPLAGRLQPRTLPSGATVIDDTYNANPDSVRAAIAVLARAPPPRWLVLGDMGEVGEQGAEFHREVGAYARAVGVDRLFGVGKLTEHAVAAFGFGAEHFEDVETLSDALRLAMTPEVTALVKGSRFMRMERVVAELSGAAAEVH